MVGRDLQKLFKQYDRGGRISRRTPPLRRRVEKRDNVDLVIHFVVVLLKLKLISRASDTVYCAAARHETARFLPYKIVDGADKNLKTWNRTYVGQRSNSSSGRDLVIAPQAGFRAYSGRSPYDRNPPNRAGEDFRREFPPWVKTGLFVHRPLSA
jgi:hypothetical protein